MIILLTGMNTLANWAEWIVKKAGTAGSWLNLVLVFLIAIDVLCRYFLDSTAVWVTELEWHLFALIFLLGAAYTLQEDGHVRVDVLLQKASPRQQSLVNLLGHLFLLIPLCLFMIPPGWDYFVQSWTIGEGSGDPGGLPVLYPIKALIPIAFILLLIQAIASCIGLLTALVGSKSPQSG